MSSRDFEKGVRACYSTWAATYYGDYYGARAVYPPVHCELLKQLLREAGARSLLDAGCGPASFLRELTGEDMDLYGFDLTPEMVAEAQKVLSARGIPSSHIWEGSALDQASFRMPSARRRTLFDAAVCVGVLPHIPRDQDEEVIRNLRSAIRRGGLVIVEARNQLFSLFTLNRYSYRFLVDDLVRVQCLADGADGTAIDVKAILTTLEQHFRMDLPPLREGKDGVPGYDLVLSRTHNPHVLKEQFAAAGFRDVHLLFYHYHCLPPMFESAMPEFFRAQSLAMEDPHDWRGYFMASAFLLAGRRS